jgi:hypothetical protein
MDYSKSYRSELQPSKHLPYLWFRRTLNYKWGTQMGQPGQNLEKCFNFFMIIGKNFDKKFKSTLRKHGNIFSVQTKSNKKLKFHSRQK